MSEYILPMVNDGDDPEVVTGQMKMVLGDWLLQPGIKEFTRQRHHPPNPYANFLRLMQKRLRVLRHEMVEHQRPDNPLRLSEIPPLLDRLISIDEMGLAVVENHESILTYEDLGIWGQMHVYHLLRNVRIQTRVFGPDAPFKWLSLPGHEQIDEEEGIYYHLHEVTQFYSWGGELYLYVVKPTPCEPDIRSACEQADHDEPDRDWDVLPRRGPGNTNWAKDGF